MNAVEQLLEQHEGRCLKVYDDKAPHAVVGPGYTLIGHPTIGIGRALDVHGLSNAEADSLLAGDIVECRNDLISLFAALWWTFTPARQAALIDMRFTLGAAGFRAFQTMLSMVRAQDWPAAGIAALNSKWATQAPSRAKYDSELLRTGAWPNV